MVFLAALLQLKPAILTNPAVEPGQDLMADNPPPVEIANILHAACYDCHSDNTQWPWYSHVAPFSWWLVEHVEAARDELNFSEWAHDDPAYASKMWRRISKVVRDGEMPMPSYTWIHARSRLTAAQRTALADWAGQQSQRLEMAASEKQP